MFINKYIELEVNINGTRKKKSDIKFNCVGEKYKDKIIILFYQLLTN